MNNDYFVKRLQYGYNNGNGLKKGGNKVGRPISNEALLLEIEEKRKQMIQSGLENGLRSDKTLQLSVQVDNLMNAFHQSRSAHLFYKH